MRNYMKYIVILPRKTVILLSLRDNPL